MALGDTVIINGNSFEVTYFTKPHKASSEGKVQVTYKGEEESTTSREYYVGIIGAEWIEREDRVNAE
ncbi:hypothetical protein OX89_09355 [Diaphorobacter sp. J5-51]|nr:hypothetical protein OX89_09355 [Diaphorobacter sp. J5-51]